MITERMQELAGLSMNEAEQIKQKVLDRLKTHQRFYVYIKKSSPYYKKFKQQKVKVLDANDKGATILAVGGNESAEVDWDTIVGFTLN